MGIDLSPHKTYDFRNCNFRSVVSVKPHAVNFSRCYERCVVFEHFAKISEGHYLTTRSLI